MKIGLSEKFKKYMNTELEKLDWKKNSIYKM
jgi:hypothetical protein